MIRRFTPLVAPVAPLSLAFLGLACGDAPPSTEGAPAKEMSSVAPPAAAAETGAPASPSPAPSSPSPSPVAAADPFANTLTVHTIHAPKSSLNPSGLMWTSPGGLTRQVLYNEAGAVVANMKHTIGHATVRVKCAADGARPAGTFAGGMTNADDASFRKLVLDQGVGLGVMFESVPGRMQTEAEVQADLDDGKTSGNTNYVRFAIAPAVCHGLLDYAKAYLAAGVDKVYGLAVRPLHKEGAGCSAFAVSFVELAGLLEPRFTKAWSFSVRVPLFTDPWIGSPEPIVGGSLNPSAFVPATRVASLTRNWATPQEQGFDIFGWDPTQMNVWLEEEIDRAQKDGSAKVEVDGKLRGLLLDRTTTAPSPALTNGTYFVAP